MASKGKRKPAHDSSDEREDDFEGEVLFFFHNFSHRLGRSRRRGD